MTVKEIISLFTHGNSGVYVDVIGNDDIAIEGLNLCNRLTEKQSIMSYAVSEEYSDTVKKATFVKALIISYKQISTYKSIILKRDGVLLVTEVPERFFYNLHEFLYAKTEFYNKLNFLPVIGSGCNISKTVVIEDGVIIGDNVIIGHHTIIRHGTVIEDNVTIGCGSIIGSEGFQLISDEEFPPMHITHTGGCHICKNVYVGDNTCICNSLFEGETYIGENVKIDNFVQVAHNLYVEKNVVITSHVVICGSARIEEGAWIAPNASIINRVTIGKYSKIGMGSVVTKDVQPYTVVYGSPAKVCIK